MGRYIWAAWPEPGGQRFRAAFEQATADQKPAFLEDYYAPLDRWFENRIYPSPEGLSVYFQDITRRKKAEALLRGQNEVLEMIAAGSPLPATLLATARLVEAQDRGM